VTAIQGLNKGPADEMCKYETSVRINYE